MISKRGVLLLKQCCKSVNLSGRLPGMCFPSITSISTSTVQNKDLKRSSVEKVRNEFLAEERKKYEDTFGDLDSFEMKFERILDDPEDIEKYRRDKAAQGKSRLQYIREIKSCLDRHDYKGAINILEVDMVNDKMRPVSHIYDMLVSYNAMQGNLKEAYRLYSNYKKYGGQVSGGMYTSLFNACALCKDSFYALEKADSIREHLNRGKGHKANIINYNAMLKAYGRHGDLTTALKIFDEVMGKTAKITSPTYNFLLQACISDRNSGLRHALIVWRKMLQYRVKPCIYTFNLLLTCVKNCSFGDVELMKDLIKNIKSESNQFFKRKLVVKTDKNNVTTRTVVKVPVKNSKIPSNLKEEPAETSQKLMNTTQITDIKNVETEEFVSLKDMEVQGYDGNTTTEVLNDQISEGEEEFYHQVKLNSNEGELNTSSSSSNIQLPNLLAIEPTTGSVIESGSMRKPHDRLIWLGGLKGFLKVMSQYNVRPDVKTFSLLLEIMPSTIQDEEEIMSEVRAHGVKFDTGFFNILIKRRGFRGETSSIQDSLRLMQKEEVKPDIITFGVLAIGCKTHEEGIQLIEAVRQYKIKLNSEILGALLKNASYARDLAYVRTILRVAKEDEVKLCPKFIIQLDEVVRKEKRLRYNERAKEISES